LVGTGVDGAAGPGLGGLVTLNTVEPEDDLGGAFLAQLGDEHGAVFPREPNRVICS
jgi:hypothetical protein